MKTVNLCLLLVLIVGFCMTRISAFAAQSEVRTLTGHSGWITSVAFSSDGKTIVSGNGNSDLNVGEVKLWDAQTGKLKYTFNINGWALSVAFSPDGKTVAGGSLLDWTVKLWDTQSGELKQTLKGHADIVTSVVFSPNGKFLASGGRDGTVKLWDVQTWELKRTITRHEGGRYHSIAFSPDSKMVVGLSAGVGLWDMQTGELKRRLTGHNNASVNSVAISPDGKTIASGSHDGTVKLWDVRNGEPKHTWRIPLSTLSAVAFSLLPILKCRLTLQKLQIPSLNHTAFMRATLTQTPNCFIGVARCRESIVTFI